MELQNRFNVRVFDYSYGDVSILTGNLKSHLAVMLELSHFDSDKDGLKALDLTKASEFIADCLKESVKGYSAEKVDVEVKLCEAGSQVLYRDTIRYKNNLLQDQIIPTRLLDNPRKMKYFYEIASF